MSDDTTTPPDDQTIDPYATVPFPENQEPVEPIVITGTIDIVLDGDDVIGGSRFPVENIAERVERPWAAPTVPEIAVFPVESDEQRAHRLEKESMSRSERLKRGW